jgi:hypothetical protein
MAIFFTPPEIHGYCPTLQPWYQAPDE